MLTDKLTPRQKELVDVRAKCYTIELEYGSLSNIPSYHKSYWLYRSLYSVLENEERDENKGS